MRILYLTSTPIVRKCHASRKNLENPGKLAPCPGKIFKVVGRYDISYIHCSSRNYKMHTINFLLFRNSSVSLHKHNIKIRIDHVRNAVSLVYRNLQRNAKEYRYIFDHVCEYEMHTPTLYDEER